MQATMLQLPHEWAREVATAEAVSLITSTEDWEVSLILKSSMTPEPCNRRKSYRHIAHVIAFWPTFKAIHCVCMRTHLDTLLRSMIRVSSIGSGRLLVPVFVHSMHTYSTYSCMAHASRRPRGSIYIAFWKSPMWLPIFV